MKAYVVLEVDTDDPGYQDMHDRLANSIVGVYRRPTMFCESASGCSTGKRVRGFTKGKKWGWWVCGVCKKPTYGWGSNHQAVVGSGVNLNDN